MYKTESPRILNVNNFAEKELDVGSKANLLINAITQYCNNDFYFIKESKRRFYVINKKNNETAYEFENIEDFIDYLCSLYDIDIELLTKDMRNKIKLAIRKQHPIKLTFDALEDKTIFAKDCVLYFNTFRYTEYMHIADMNIKHNHLNEEEFKEIFPHFSALLLNLCENNYAYVKVLLNYIAAIVQKREKLGCVITFRGLQGAGKNILFDTIIKPLLKKEQTLTTSLKALEGRFNSDLINKLAVLIDESEYDIKKASNVAEKIKHLSTTSFIRAERKNKDAIQVKTFFNFFVFTNKNTGIKVDPDDRRFYVFKTQDSLAKIFKRKFKIKKDVRKYIKQNMFNSSESKMFLAYVASLDINLDYASEAKVVNSTKMQMIFSTNSLLDLFVKIVEKKDFDMLISLHRDLQRINTENKIYNEDNNDNNLITVNDEDIDKFFVELIQDNKVKTTLMHKMLELYLSQNSHYSTKRISFELKKIFEIKKRNGYPFYYLPLKVDFQVEDFFEKIKEDKNEIEISELVEEDFDYIELYQKNFSELLEKGE